ncbi:MAG TPA: uroporphyrinogen-III synthase [Chitinophagaceae bacterium]|jgi:uroporphyrinogen-III synthase|nr:uroporphyrinogen-III synthase [Chitinophagaceae bacterium]
MLQNRINILCTRNIDNVLIQDGLSKNIAIDVISFIKTEPALTSEVLREVQEASGNCDAVAFTSSSAVEAIAAGLDLQKATIVGRKIFCIGHVTKESVVKHFGERLIGGFADNAKELAQAIISANVKGVIFFCGNQRRDELPMLLKKNKIDVKEIVVYETIAIPRKIEKKYDGILFFSPSAVKSFFQQNKSENEVILFAIGDTTANEIKNFSKNKIVVSDVPDKKTLLDKVFSYFQLNPIHH